MNRNDNSNQNVQKFSILYTHQKLKKSKTWKDGFLKTSINSTKIAIYSESHDLIDSFHYRLDKIISGAEIESDQLLIQVQDSLTENSYSVDNRRNLNSSPITDNSRKGETRAKSSQPFKKLKLSNQFQSNAGMEPNYKIYQPNSTADIRPIRSTEEILKIIGIDCTSNSDINKTKTCKKNGISNSSKSSLELEIDLDCFSD